VPSEWETWRKTEDEATGPVVSRSWVVEVEPPYRTGNGFRLRLGRRAWHLGICHPNPDAGPLGFVGGGGVEVTPEQIGKWTFDEVGQEETADA